MSRPNYEINRLSNDELAYELAIRGITKVKTVDDMRKTLRQLLRLEKENNSLAYPSYPFEYTADSNALTAKLKEIQELFDNFDGSDQGLHKKLLSKLAHSIGRINISLPKTDEELKNRSELLVEFLTLKSDVQKKVKSFHRQSSTPLTLDQQCNESASSSDDEILECFSNFKLESNKDATNMNSVRSSQAFITVPIHMWNLKFTGEPTDMSVSAFLEKVEELAIARHVSESNLFDGIIELLDGNALCWYRSLRKHLIGWKDFSQKLREQFQPPDYNSRLFEEIKKRTQGREENIGIYVAIMENLFSRLSTQLSEQSRLQIVLKNLTPYYQRQLGTSVIETFEDLLNVGKLIELRKINAGSYVALTTELNKLLEPELGIF